MRLAALHRRRCARPRPTLGHRQPRLALFGPSRARPRSRPGKLLPKACWRRRAEHVMARDLTPNRASGSALAPDQARPSNRSRLQRWKPVSSSNICCFEPHARSSSGLITVTTATPIYHSRKVHQFDSGSSPGDAITNAMLLMQRWLRSLGY